MLIVGCCYTETVREATRAGPPRLTQNRLRAYNICTEQTRNASGGSRLTMSGFIERKQETLLPRIPRDIPDLVEALQRHVKLLKEFSIRAFRDGDYDYLGEIAAKLRLLVYEYGRNKPLLLTLMDEFGLKVPIVMGGPPIERPAGWPAPGDQVSLREFLNLIAFGMRAPSGAWVELTKKEIIGIWAQQHGAAHEDWELDQTFKLARDSGLFIGGRPALAAELRTTTEAVISVADRFIGMLTPPLIALRNAERFLKTEPNSVSARHARGIALAQLGQYNESLDEFGEVASAEPTNVKAHNNIGLALLHLRRFDEALEAFRRAIHLDEDYADAHYNLACVYSLQGNFSQCLDELERVKLLDGFATKDPASDSDLASIYDNPEYGPRFRVLVRSQEGNA